MSLRIWYRAALAMSFTVMVSCGGGSDAVTPPPPPPPPVVTTIEVSPATKAMLVGDTITLGAVVRDQNGATMPGVTLTWSSQSAAVASVSSTGKVTALSAGTTVIIASAAGKTGTATLTITIPTPSATLEPSNRITATIGSNGGTLTATSSAGIQYTLEIPAGALQSAQDIRMTPITDITHLGLSGGLAGAVDLQPSGLIFAEPARLRIKSARTAPNGTRLVGFSANANFTERELAFTATSAGETVVLVSHFSIGGAGFGTTSEVSQFPIMQNQTLNGIIAQVVAISPAPWNAAGLTQATQLAQQAFDQIVLPQLNTAATDPALLDAISDYGGWRIMLSLIVNGGSFPVAALGVGAFVLNFPPAFQDEVQRANDAAADAIKLAINANADVCGTQASLNALRNVYFWEDWAEDLGVATVAHGLDAQAVSTIVRTKCATVVLSNSNLPDSIPAGQNFNLDLNFALRFRNGVEQFADFRVDLIGAGVSVTNPGGFTGIGNATSPVGYYTTVINPDSDLGFRLRSQTCFVPVRSTPDPTSLCGAFELTKVIYFNDFEGAVGSEWTLPGKSTTPSGEDFLGELSNDNEVLTVDSIPQHTTLILEFDLFIIGSWNGNAEDPVAGLPDIIEISVQGGPSLKKTTFSNKIRDRQAFPGDFPGSSFPPGSGAAEMGALLYPVGSDFVSDAVYKLRLTFPHTATSVKLNFNGNHNGSIERWGIDNVRVKFGT